jgi:thymidylate kinase
MSSVAIIGPDGAGKTTITQQLVASGFYPFKYIYMGTNVDSCSHVLPTTRFVQRFKKWFGLTEEEITANTNAGAVRKAGRSFRQGWLWAAARLLNNLAEEWYRQIISWYYQWKGFVVLYDRHFVFDLLDSAAVKPRSISNRIHDWCLRHLYPRPDLVIFLDAPPEVLYARKPEWPLEELARRRRTLEKAGGEVRRFVRLDATLPLETVYRETVKCITEFCEGLPRIRPRWRPAGFLAGSRDN